MYHSVDYLGLMDKVRSAKRMRCCRGEVVADSVSIFVVVSECWRGIIKYTINQALQGLAPFLCFWGAITAVRKCEHRKFGCYLRAQKCVSISSVLFSHNAWPNLLL